MSARLTSGVLVAAILAACGGGQSAAPAAPEPEPLPVLRPLPEAGLPPYELIPGGRLVVMLATNAHDTLYGGVTAGVSSSLVSAGFSLLSLNLPCHEPGEATLRCWQERITAGDDDLFLRFCAALSNVLDERGVREAAIVGQSRGGYVALTCAAYDARIRQVVLLVPVTDLNRLAEFANHPADAELFGTDQYAPYLRSREVLVRIGMRDERVGTDAAVAFAESVGAELHLLDVDGHSIPDDGAVAAWLNGMVSP